VLDEPTFGQDADVRELLALLAEYRDVRRDRVRKSRRAVRRRVRDERLRLDRGRAA